MQDEFIIYFVETFLSVVIQFLLKVECVWRESLVRLSIDITTRCFNLRPRYVAATAATTSRRRVNAFPVELS